MAADPTVDLSLGTVDPLRELALAQTLPIKLGR
jgi:hypothetical protein